MLMVSIDSEVRAVMMVLLAVAVVSTSAATTLLHDPMATSGTDESMFFSNNLKMEGPDLNEGESMIIKAMIEKQKQSTSQEEQAVQASASLSSTQVPSKTKLIENDGNRANEAEEASVIRPASAEITAAAATSTAAKTTTMKTLAIVSSCTGKAVEYCNISFANHRDYASRHGYKYIGHYNNDRASNEESKWTKIRTLLEALQDYDIAMWIDADAVFTNKLKSLEDLFKETTFSNDLLIARDAWSHVPFMPPPILVNSGVMIFRNSAWSRTFLSNVLSKGKVLEKEYNFGFTDQPRVVKELLDQGEMPPNATEINHKGQHVTIVRPGVMNAFLRHDERDQDPWEPGMFICHMAGMKNADRLPKFAEIEDGADEAAAAATTTPSAEVTGVSITDSNRNAASASLVQVNTNSNTAASALTRSDGNDASPSISLIRKAAFSKALGVVNSPSPDDSATGSTATPLQENTNSIAAGLLGQQWQSMRLAKEVAMTDIGRTWAADPASASDVIVSKFEDKLAVDILFALDAGDADSVHALMGFAAQQS